MSTTIINQDTVNAGYVGFNQDESISDVSALSNSKPIPAPANSIACVQVVFDSLDAVDSTVQVQQSNDGVNYDDVVGATDTLSAASGSLTIDVSAFGGRWFRVQYTPVSVTSGTVDLFTTLKP